MQSSLLCHFGREKERGGRKVYVNGGRPSKCDALGDMDI